MLAIVFKITLIFFHLFPDQLSRLHMILKPFMLRRVKKDVENELSDKVGHNAYAIRFKFQNT